MYKWNTEPDHKVWIDETTGYACEIKRHETMKHLCGYVTFNEGDVNMEDMEGSISVHGGVTYTDKKTNTVGFDCAHAGDHVPELRNIETDTRQYRDMDYVTKECTNMAVQIKHMKEEKTS